MKSQKILKCSHFWEQVPISSTVVIYEGNGWGSISRGNQRLDRGFGTFPLLYSGESHKKALINGKFTDGIKVQSNQLYGVSDTSLLA